MKKLTLFIILIFLSILTACSSESSNAEGEVVKVGIRSSELRTWEFIKEKAKEEGIVLEIVNFSSTYDPNQALADGEVDINAFQHIAYLNSFNENTGSDIVPIGTTIMAPLGLYSIKYESIKDIPDGAQIAVPNDAVNWGRALLLLQEEGLITVVDDFDGNGGEDKIKDNPKKFEIVPVESFSTPRVMEDVAASIINNGAAFEAGLRLDEALIHENETAKPFINVIATRSEEKDNETLNKIVELYQSEETAKFIEETYEGNYIPTFITLEDLSTWKDFYSTR
jgi:D-methionine transport system substrate-binding protein